MNEALERMRKHAQSGNSLKILITTFFMYNRKLAIHTNGCR
jgi:hypothetical protein